MDAAWNTKAQRGQRTIKKADRSALIALPVLRGWQRVTLISPVFVALLLTRVNGVPMLEKRAGAK